MADVSIGTCPDHDKKWFSSRRIARAFIRKHYPYDRGMREYPCGDWWHIGHLPRGIKDGLFTEAEWKGNHP